MDQLAPLFQAIEFHERFRGYDPDEVDAYVDRVAQAAALLRGRLSELQERVDASEARGDTDTNTIDTEGTLARTLVLAQRTADAAIAEAREEAERTIAEATTLAESMIASAQAEADITIKQGEDHASLVRAEAETDRRQLATDAAAIAAEAATQERERITADVAELQQYRDFLADDIEILERHLAVERQQLTASLSVLTELLHAPEAFRSNQTPEISGIEITEALLAQHSDEASSEDEFPDDPFPYEPTVEESAVSDKVDAEYPVTTLDGELDEIEETIDLVAAEESHAQPTPGLDPLAGAAGDESAAETPNRDDDVMSIEIDLDRQDEEPVGDVAPAPDVAFVGARETNPGVAAFDISTFEATSPPLLATAADVEPSLETGSRIGLEGGPPTAPVPTVQEASLFADPVSADDDPFLTQLRDAVDREPVLDGDEDALTAFFDQEDDDGGRSWFGRRR